MRILEENNKWYKLVRIPEPCPVTRMKLFLLWASVDPRIIEQIDFCNKKLLDEIVDHLKYHGQQGISFSFQKQVKKLFPKK